MLSTDDASFLFAEKTSLSFIAHQKGGSSAPFDSSWAIHHQRYLAMATRGWLIGCLGFGTVLAGAMIGAFAIGNEQLRRDEGRGWELRRLRRSPCRGRRDRRHVIYPRRHVQDGLRAPSARGALHPRSPRRRLLDRPSRGDERAVQAVRRRDRVRHAGRAGARSQGEPEREKDLLIPGSVVFIQPMDAGRRPAHAVVAIRNGCRSASRAAPAVRSPARKIIRSFTSPTRTRSPTRAGAAAACRRKPSGSMPPGAAATAKTMVGRVRC